MTTTTPRTRRELRQALADARLRVLRLEGELDASRTSSERHQATSAALGTDLDNAVSKLIALGYYKHSTASAEDGQVFHEWRPTLAPEAVTFSQADVNEATRKERQYTLQTVIDALELRQYGAKRDRSDGLSFYTILSESINGPERLWSDLQTALEVRAEKKAAEERRATEAKVAGIARRPDGSAFFISGDTIGFDPAFPRVADLLKREDAFWLNLTSDPGAAGSSYDSSSTLPKPAAAKKSAKKKPEGKK